MKHAPVPAQILAMFLAFLLLPCLEARSWQEIQASRKLRVLTADVNRENLGGYDGLHRIIMPIDREQALLRSFARRHGLQIEYIFVPQFEMLFTMLESDAGDLISANLSETPDRKKKYLLSQPFDHTREMVFTASGSSIRGTDPSCLKGKTGKILPGTSYFENLRVCTVGTKEIVIKELPGTINHDDLIEKVADGTIEYSVLDECDLNAWLSYRSGIRKLFPVKDKVPLVFASTRKFPDLIRQLNTFIREVKSPVTKTESPGESSGSKEMFPIFHGDLAAIRKRGYIRMLTCNDPFCCYIHGGRLCGFEYELAKRFADSLGVVLVTIIPENFQELTKFLQEGKGDFIAANFAKTPDRIRRFPDLVYGPSYFENRQVMAGRSSENITSAGQLKGRKVYALKGKSHIDTLRRLKSSGYAFELIPILQDESSMQTLRKVESGEYDLAAVDETYLKLAASAGRQVKELFPLTGKETFHWVVRKQNPQLQAAVNAFFKKEYRSTFFNLCRIRYYSPKDLNKQLRIAKNQKTLSPYDVLFRKYARLYDFNWCLLAAQSYQESRFQTDLVNHIGATGLMQVMPETAKELGISNLTEPENGIHAGTKYLAKLRKRFPDAATQQDQVCFALASYNAGYGHVKDARKLAKKMGLDHRKWFRNTEKALALLEDSRYASRAQYGYCRASETIPYVSNIATHAYLYWRVIDGKIPALPKKDGSSQTPQGPEQPKDRLKTR